MVLQWPRNGRAITAEELRSGGAAKKNHSSRVES